MSYTDAQLAIVCPKCKGVGKCLEKTLWGSKYIDDPHPERVQAAEEKVDV
jgi:hypothetical protein